LRLQQQRNRLTLLQQRQATAITRGLEQRRGRLREVVRALASVSPLATLARGYAIVQRADSGAVVKRAADVDPGDQLDAQLAEGRMRLRVERTD
jgi:exodeoxyribonuclease VII large subunit